MTLSCWQFTGWLFTTGAAWPLAGVVARGSGDLGPACLSLVFPVTWAGLHLPAALLYLLSSGYAACGGLGGVHSTLQSEVLSVAGVPGHSRVGTGVGCSSARPGSALSKCVVGSLPPRARGLPETGCVWVGRGKRCHQALFKHANDSSERTGWRECGGGLA